MISYELVDLIDQYTEEVTGAIVKRFNLDGSVSCIPLDPANSDYQAYLLSLEPSQ
jgi:hypothetical protein